MVSAQQAATSVEKRAPRRSAARVPSITALRFSPHGIDATLVNISETGLLAECAQRLRPGSVVVVNFEGTIKVRSVGGRVARSCVSSMGADHSLRYHVGIAFQESIALDDDPVPVKAEIEATIVAPIPVRNRW